jgi:hypothetical protein
MTVISKSDYLKFIQCSSFYWYWKNDQSVLSKELENPFNDRLKSQGYEVELFARNLYPSASLVTGKLKDASDLTTELIKGNIKKLFQASFLVEGLFSSCDILIWNDMYDGWDIIEVKSSTDKEKKSKEHILDAAFQRIVVQKSGLKVVNVYLLKLNKEYYKNGDIDPYDIFTRSEITTECIRLEQGIIAGIQEAKELLLQSNPLDCLCKFKGRSNHCRVFNHLYPKIPTYSIYDLRGIGQSKEVLIDLVDNKYFSLGSIPDDFELSIKHENQKWVSDTKNIIFEQDLIRDRLSNLEYPLYFLDYETLACGIPKFDNTYPYQQTVFQYSLHILSEDGEIDHKEYIHNETSTPVHIVAQKLRQDIGDEGHVVVWNKGFEGKCNSDLALVNPDLESFLLGLNTRIFDLMEVFLKMEYLHNDFKGSYSIKNVLPVMCPDLSYDGLAVSNGTEAVVEYENLIFGKIPDELKESKFKALLEYCKLDTLAMVRIFQELLKMIKVGQN